MGPHGGVKNINDERSSNNIEFNDVPAPMEHHQNDHQNYEMPIVSQSNIDVGSNESGDEVVVEAKRRRKSPPVQIRYNLYMDIKLIIHNSNVINSF